MAQDGQRDGFSREFGRPMFAGAWAASEEGSGRVGVYFGQTRGS